MASSESQDNHIVETVNASVLLKEKLVEAENAISVLRDEKGTATCTIVKITQEREDELERKWAIDAELEALRRKHRAMVGYQSFSYWSILCVVTVEYFL